MSKKWVTSYDVAKVAGVSQSAVSRTFSPGRSVSQETREKVLAAAEKLGFAPNPLAQSLRSGRSRLVGFVITQFAHRNFPIVLKSALDVLSRTGENLVLQMVESEAAGDAAVDRLIEARVTMIVCAADVTASAAKACREAKIPLVIINRRLNFEGVDQVASDHSGIMARIASLLFAKNVNKILYLDGPPTSWVNFQRRTGFLDRCAELGVPAPVVRPGLYTDQGGYDAVASMGESVEGFQAIVSSNDQMAIGAIDALRERHLSPPKDILVIGHDDTPAANLRAYNLTTIRQDMNALVSRAIQLAFERLEDPQKEGETVVFGSKLIERASVISK